MTEQGPDGQPIAEYDKMRRGMAKRKLAREKSPPKRRIGWIPFVPGYRPCLSGNSGRDWVIVVACLLTLYCLLAAFLALLLFFSVLSGESYEIHRIYVAFLLIGLASIYGLVRSGEGFRRVQYRVAKGGGVSPATSNEPEAVAGAGASE